MIKSPETSRFHELTEVCKILCILAVWVDLVIDVLLFISVLLLLLDTLTSTQLSLFFS